MDLDKALKMLKGGKDGVREWNQRRESGVKIPELSGVDLSGVDLSGAVLFDSQLSGADLEGAFLIGADLTGADLAGALLHGANLEDTRLGFTGLDSADLSFANFTNAELFDTGLRGADFEDAVCLSTKFANVDLSEAKGLESINHLGPSTLGIDTVFRSKGKIPDAFLRGCGVPETLITFHRSLTGAALEFHSCFISFSEPDDAFSKRLYNDLQGEGVRCWRWKEDARWGGTLMRQVDDGIRVYDKLVVVCSANSLKSEPMIREIEHALQREQRDGKEVLFPIRLDDSIFGWDHFLQADVVRKVVGDFRKWKTPKAYRAAFDRLLHDLRAGESTASPD